jgi:broad specificity phosphatase PhoE
MGMKLFLIRHGESENNFNRCYSGQCNPKLTQLGRSQAEKIRPILKNIKFGAVFSSDLIRALETCELALPDANPVVTPKLREIAIGSLENQPYYIPKSDDDKYYIELQKNRKAFDYSPYGGESADDVVKRFCEFLKELETKPYENVAAFCHAGLITIVIGHILSAFLDREAIHCPNCSINVLEFDGEKWRLLVWNYGAQLGEGSE